VPINPIIQSRAHYYSSRNPGHVIIYTCVCVHVNTSTVHTLDLNMEAACTSETSKTPRTFKWWNHLNAELTRTRAIHIFNKLWNEGICNSTVWISGTNDRHENTQTGLPGCDAANMVDHQRFGGKYCTPSSRLWLVLLVACLTYLRLWIWKAIRSSYLTTRRHNIVDSILQLERKMQTSTYTPCSCPWISGVETRPPQILEAIGVVGQCCWGRWAGRR
jgi:hypothetical protein